MTIQSKLQTYLLANGVPRQRTDICVGRALNALENCLRSTRGRWLLAEHQDAASELALTGVIDGMPVHAVIDRTFIDESGERWVIDYKTSEPGEGEGLQEFLTREMGRYRPQLKDYSMLITLHNPQTMVRTALYFPLNDAWCEVD